MPESAVGFRNTTMNKTDCLKWETWMKKIMIKNTFGEKSLSSQEGQLR